MKNKQWDYIGFTLVEMMVTVAIIGILAAIAVPSYREHVEKTNLAYAQSEMSEAATFFKSEMVKKPSYFENDIKTEGKLKTEADKIIDSEIRKKYDFNVSFITRSPADAYKVGFQVYAVPKNSDYRYAAWADSRGANYACIGNNRAANIAAAKAFQTTSPCVVK